MAVARIPKKRKKKTGRKFKSSAVYFNAGVVRCTPPTHQTTTARLRRTPGRRKPPALGTTLNDRDLSHTRLHVERASLSNSLVSRRRPPQNNIDPHNNKQHPSLGEKKIRICTCTLCINAICHV